MSFLNLKDHAIVLVLMSLCRRTQPDYCAATGPSACTAADIELIESDCCRKDESSSHEGSATKHSDIERVLYLLLPDACER